jgi:hypothetical protein
MTTFLVLVLLLASATGAMLAVADDLSYAPFDAPPERATTSAGDSDEGPTR